MALTPLAGHLSAHVVLEHVARGAAAGRVELQPYDVGWGGVGADVARRGGTG